MRNLIELSFKTIVNSDVGKDHRFHQARIFFSPFLPQIIDILSVWDSENITGFENFHIWSEALKDLIICALESREFHNHCFYELIKNNQPAITNSENEPVDFTVIMQNSLVNYSLAGFNTFLSLRILFHGFFLLHESKLNPLLQIILVRNLMISSMKMHVNTFSFLTLFLNNQDLSNNFLESDSDIRLTINNTVLLIPNSGRNSLEKLQNMIQHLIENSKQFNSPGQSEYGCPVHKMKLSTEISIYDNEIFERAINAIFRATSHSEMATLKRMRKNMKLD